MDPFRDRVYHLLLEKGAEGDFLNFAGG